MQNKLESIKFKVNQAPTGQPEMSFAKFLVPFEGGWLTIAEWLACTPRQALDRITMFEQLAKSGQSEDQGDTALPEEKNKSDDRLIAKLFDAFQREFSEDGLLTYAMRKRLLDAFDTSVGISLDLSFLRFSEYYSYTELNDSNDYKLVDLTPSDLRLSILTGNEVEQRNDNVKEIIVGTQLNRRQGANLLFIHDLVVSLWGGYLRHSPLTYSPNNHLLVYYRNSSVLSFRSMSSDSIKFGARVQVRWKTEIEEYVVVQWNIPEFWTFRDVDRFTAHWKKHKAQCQTHYGQAWLAALLEVVLNEDCQPGSSGLTSERLTGLLMKLVTEDPSRTARRLLWESALISIALLLAPEAESGINVSELMDSKTDFLNEIQKPVLAKRIREARARTWLNAWNEGNIIDKPQRVVLCERIAPDILLKRMMINMRGFYKIHITDSSKLQVLEKLIQASCSDDLNAFINEFTNKTDQPNASTQETVSAAGQLDTAFKIVESTFAEIIDTNRDLGGYTTTHTTTFKTEFEKLKFTISEIKKNNFNYEFNTHENRTFVPTIEDLNSVSNVKFLQ